MRSINELCSRLANASYQLAKIEHQTYENTVYHKCFSLEAGKEQLRQDKIKVKRKIERAKEAIIDYTERQDENTVNCSINIFGNII